MTEDNTRREGYGEETKWYLTNPFAEMYGVMGRKQRRMVDEFYKEIRDWSLEDLATYQHEISPIGKSWLRRTLFSFDRKKQAQRVAISLTMTERFFEATPERIIDAERYLRDKGLPDFTEGRYIYLC